MDRSIGCVCPFRSKGSVTESKLSILYLFHTYNPSTRSLTCCWCRKLAVAITIAVAFSSFAQHMLSKFRGIRAPRLSRSIATAASMTSVPKAVTPQTAVRRLNAVSSTLGLGVSTSSQSRMLHASPASQQSAPVDAASTSVLAVQATDPEVVPRKVGSARLLILNRPKALNALSTDMCVEMAKWVNVS